MLIRKLARRFKECFNTSLVGFVTGHCYLNSRQLKDVRLKVGTQSTQFTKTFESKFAGIVGCGDAVSFASGRMGFFAVMKVMGIGVGDEVILCGSTCSVMPNAVLKTGATPIYADIDPKTYGSSKHSVESSITSSTKLVVAQHSFGIPCEIDSIAKLCEAKKIYLIEDCALALGSQLRSKSVGTFSDAAIFSTDHSKPINTIIGGLIYSENADLVKKLRLVQQQSEYLPQKKQKAIWKQFVAEKFLARPITYGILHLYNSITAFRVAKLGGTSPFLDEDGGFESASKSYAYPSKMPEFTSLLGIYELERWECTLAEREASL
ncbi:MAG: DegT/DnrJ/EryC1/StrS family aminotransferase, partial [Alphaproteobacteria bacterium]|nr:DegT/DnrJ/EryC1/StrS family aminotransferase [Alphaproteobacteria bacterium]